MNQRQGLTITFSFADLPLLAGALSIARNEAMMRNRPRQKERLEALRLQFNAAIPDAARIFSSYDFCDLILAVEAGAEYKVETHRRDWYCDPHIVAVVGDKRYRSRDTFKSGHEEVVSSVLLMLDEVSRIGADA